ncbi:D-2-hydroxyacid dehydrogenase [Halopiger aswanensis]|uniref:Phosphoglycerate dehydrogenase-like enzyme n=1 Tax=Halopiger aswanensis TaxID=148449 RepID=A0A419WIF9_9EURY|nr:D-2-hydroxyacid dehydrogenase [Halopiger aswanensis]RKD95237.1 phosphoglycerate dehydrogenase-like enzyme [Halopiger aswanensis]
MTDIDILVLRRGTHGIPAREYVDALEDRLPDRRIELATTPREERDLAEQARVITSTDIDLDLLERAAALEVFAGVAAGYGHLPLEELAERGVAVTNASGIHAPNIAEQVLAYVLAHTRNLRTGYERQAQREWRHFQAGELQGSTVTVVGLGAIGTAIAERLEPFGVETIGVRYTPEKGGPTDEVIGFDADALHEALARTDYLLIAAPLTETTRGLIGEAELETLPPDAYLVNVGRGPIVETDALVTALRKGHLDGAALDVTDPEPLPEDHPLWNLGNVTITPHNAGHSPKLWDRLADIVAENVRKLDDGADPEALTNLVRAPE